MPNEPWKFQNRRFVSDNPAKTFGDKSTKDAVALMAGDKKTFPDVNYTQASYGARDRCSECKFYESPGEGESSCMRVIGIVKGDGVCDLFEQRDYRLPDEPGKTTEIVIRLNGG